MLSVAAASTLLHKNSMTKRRFKIGLAVLGVLGIFFMALLALVFGSNLASANKGSGLGYQQDGESQSSNHHDPLGSRQRNPGGPGYGVGQPGHHSAGTDGDGCAIGPCQSARNEDAPGAGANAGNGPGNESGPSGPSGNESGQPGNNGQGGQGNSSGPFFGGNFAPGIGGGPLGGGGGSQESCTSGKDNKSQSDSKGDTSGDSKSCDKNSGDKSSQGAGNQNSQESNGHDSRDGDSHGTPGGDAPGGDFTGIDISGSTSLITDTSGNGDPGSNDLPPGNGPTGNGPTGDGPTGDGPTNLVLSDTPIQVPEPFTLSLFAVGLGGAAMLRRRSQKRFAR